MLNKHKRAALWLSGVFIITVIFGTIYTTTQQILRESANDPQIQLAEDAAAALNSGKQPSDIVSGKVDINNSLAPFVIIYDKNGNVVAGNGYLDDQLADPPFGSLEASSNKTYNAVTWAPYSNVRVATVSVSANDYYVFSGRSLREVEIRENNLLKISGLGWLASILMILLAFSYTKTVYHKHNKSNKTKNAENHPHHQIHQHHKTGN